MRHLQNKLNITKEKKTGATGYFLFAFDCGLAIRRRKSVTYTKKDDGKSKRGKENIQLEIINNKKTK